MYKTTLDRSNDDLADAFISRAVNQDNTDDYLRSITASKMAHKCPSRP